jgi:hypothetical protein
MIPSSSKIKGGQAIPEYVSRCDEKTFLRWMRLREMIKDNKEIYKGVKNGHQQDDPNHQEAS